jgi:L-asparaginase
MTINLNDMSEKTIQFIMTGGTIDSHYDGTIDTVVPNETSIIPKYINGLKLHIKTEFTQICMKDSRDMTLDDMENVKKAIEQSKYKYFIITHGTYCMPDTARYLKQHLKKEGSVIILTGSMIPLEMSTGSDALFNLGFSVAEVFHLEPGIYVCMNGKIFDPNEIAKLIGQGRFVSIFGEKEK